MTLGEYKLHSQVEPLPPQTYHVARAVVHPNFKFSPAADRFDVAVLRLDRPVQVRIYLQPFPNHKVLRNKQIECEDSELLRAWLQCHINIVLTTHRLAYLCCQCDASFGMKLASW